MGSFILLHSLFDIQTRTSSMETLAEKAAEHTAQRNLEARARTSRIRGDLRRRYSRGAISAGSSRLDCCLTIPDRASRSWYQRCATGSQHPASSNIPPAANSPSAIPTPQCLAVDSEHRRTRLSVLLASKRFQYKTHEAAVIPHQAEARSAKKARHGQRDTCTDQRNCIMVGIRGNDV